MNEQPVASATDRVTAIRAELGRARAAATVADAMAALTSIYRHVVALEHAGVLEEFAVMSATLAYLNVDAPDGPEVSGV